MTPARDAMIPAAADGGGALELVKIKCHGRIL
jgi:hypothetical protein